MAQLSSRGTKCDLYRPNLRSSVYRVIVDAWLLARMDVEMERRNGDTDSVDQSSPPPTNDSVSPAINSMLLRCLV